MTEKEQDQNIPAYGRSDFRRMLMALNAVEMLGPDKATLVKIVAASGVDKRSVQHLLDSAGRPAGVVIAKNAPAYAIANWGPVLKKSGARLAMSGSWASPFPGRNEPLANECTGNLVNFFNKTERRQPCKTRSTNRNTIPTSCSMQ